MHSPSARVRTRHLRDLASLCAAAEYASRVVRQMRGGRPPNAWRGGGRPLRVLTFPAASNPYQRLLHTALVEASGDSVKFATVGYHKIFGGLPLILRLPIYRARGYRIVHIQWPEFRISRYAPASRSISSALFFITLRLFRVCGMRVVWTIHNVTPHEAHTRDDLAAARALSNSADAKFVHSPRVLHEIRQLEMDSSNTTVIPHGNYIGYYPTSVGRNAVRVDLGVNAEQVLFGFVGLIRAYKGVDELLTASKTLDPTRTQLLIAGKCSDAHLGLRLMAAAERGVIVRPGHVPDNELADLLDAMDLVCLPFRRVTTSGSALLAMSYGRPVIAPRLGALIDLPADVGYFYDPRDPTGLAASMNEAARDTNRAQKGEHAYAYAQSLQWSDSARLTLAAYRRLHTLATGTR
jgi:beta-1,4-mannosyltransferase